MGLQPAGMPESEREDAAGKCGEEEGLWWVGGWLEGASCQLGLQLN